MLPNDPMKDIQQEANQALPSPTLAFKKRGRFLGTKRTFERRMNMSFTEQREFYDRLKPQAQEYFSKPPEQRAIERLGYVPTFGQDPKEVARAYQQIKATPEGQALPAWMEEQREGIEQAYNWHSFNNPGKTPESWKYLNADNPGLGYLSTISGPPPKEKPPGSQTQAVKDGQAGWDELDPGVRADVLSDPKFDITTYPVEVRDQILKDPNFDWTRLPKWQKKYWEVMSNPYIMASPMALAGARVGRMLGPLGTAIGAGVGYGLGVVGGQEYDPMGGVLEQPTTTAAIMAVLNKLSEGAEQSIGFTAQLADAAIAGSQGNEQAADAAKRMLLDKDFRRATWEAGRLEYEVADLFGARNWMPMLGKLFGDSNAELAPGGYDWIIGSADPVERNREKRFNPVTGNMVDVTNGDAILREARLTIHAAIIRGASEEEIKDVIRGLLSTEGQYVGGQLSDFAGQMMIDPLEQLPYATNKASGTLARMLGNETAARSFAETSAPFEAARRYKTLVQAGDVPASFDYQQMGSVSRWIAGLNDQGQIRAGQFTQTGLLDTPAKRNGIWNKIKEDWAALTPEARAREGANMFYNNMSVLLSTFDDPHDIGKYMRSLSKGDMKLWREMGSKVANSPEWYTVLPALKDYDAKKIDGLLAAWDISAAKRSDLTNIAGLLGEDPGKFIEDLAKRGTAEEDFHRVTQRLTQTNSPQAREMLARIERGEFTATSLADVVDAFTGEGALYWHPDQWKAALLESMGEHFDNWTVEKLGLGKDTPETKAFFRTTKLLKSAQSVLLLGGSPGYALQNGLSNMVHRAATGIYGYMTPKQIDAWLDRFGVSPARLEEGVGIGGIVEVAKTKSKVKTSAIEKAMTGDQRDVLGRAQRMVTAIGKKMPFNKLSSWFESVEGKNGYMIAMRDMWSKTWRRGVGFEQMTPELSGHLRKAGVNPDHIYNLIEAGMNQAEIERFIFTRQKGIQSRSLINDAAKRSGRTASEVSTLLDKIGLLDELDKFLVAANTPEKIRYAFDQARKKAQDFQDIQTFSDLKAMAENVTNKVHSEGAAAALDVVQQVQGEFFDAWLDHYDRFGNLFDQLSEIEDQAVKSQAIELHYEISDQEFRRVNARLAANYQGVFDAWGKSRNTHAMQIMASIAQMDSAMKSAYDNMRRLRREFFDTYIGSDRPSLEAQAAWGDMQSQIGLDFDQAFESKAIAERAMGDAMGKLYEEMYGPPAGVAAKKWWTDYAKMSAEIVKRERKARAAWAKMNKEQRAASKKRYYGTDKVAQIAELERINQEGIKRLDRTIRKGRGGSGSGTGTDGNPPQGPIDPDINSMMVEAEKAAAQEKAAEAAKVQSVWDAAEEFRRDVFKYDRTVLQDRFALLGALKKEEYQGIPDLKGLNDPRLTPEIVRDILARREATKEIEAASNAKNTVDRMAMLQDGGGSVDKGLGIDVNTSILVAIKKHGGLKLSQATDIVGEKKPGGMVGLFRKQGVALDQLAILLADDGYPIDLHRVGDEGGIQQITDLINKARSGDKIYPVGHDFDADIRRAEKINAKAQPDITTPDMAVLDEIDMAATWVIEFDAAADRGDLTRVYDLIGDFPEDLGNTRMPGEEVTYNDYMSRIADETAAKIEEAARMDEVANHMAIVETQIEDMRLAADAAMSKHLLREKVQKTFDLSEAQAAGYIELTDAVSRWYAEMTGETAEDFYARYYEDVRKQDAVGLFQETNFAFAGCHKLVKSGPFQLIGFDPTFVYYSA